VGSNSASAASLSLPGGGGSGGGSGGGDSGALSRCCCCCAFFRLGWKYLDVCEGFSSVKLSVLIIGCR